MEQFLQLKQEQAERQKGECEQRIRAAQLAEMAEMRAQAGEERARREEQRAMRAEQRAERTAEREVARERREQELHVVRMIQAQQAASK